MGAMVDLVAYYTFASDADRLAIWGGGFVLLGLLALVAERLRGKRARIDRVGWMPWTAIFLASAIIGLGLLALAVPGILAG